MLKNFDLKKTSRTVVDLKRLKQEAASARLESQKTTTRSFSEKPAGSYANNRVERINNPLAKKKGFSILAFLIILLFLLVGAAAAGFFVFNSKDPAGKSLKLSLAMPKEITAGEDFSLALAYENLDKVSLNQIEIVAEYPDNFYFTEASIEPRNKENNIWQPGPVKPAEKGMIQIKGYAIGEIGEEKEFRIIFHYQPENFNSDFREEISKKAVIAGSILKVKTESPQLLEDGATAELKVEYSNNTKEPLRDLVLAFDVGDAFLISESYPAASGTTWQIAELKPETSQNIVVKGKINAALANPFGWIFKAWLKQPSGQDRYLYQTVGKIKTETPKIVVALSLADSEQKINWGETVNYKINLENNGEISINQPALKLIFSSGLIDWPKFNNQNNATVDAAKNSLIWLSANGGWANSLAELKPGDKLETTVALPLVSEPVDLANLEPEELILDAVLNIVFKTQKEQKVISSEHIINSILSAPRLVTEAKYYLDQQTVVGTGPLPPVIGQATSYRIYWKLFSGSKGLKNVKIKTTLPAYINWQEDSSEVTYGAGLKFDNSTRELVWEIDSLAANSQVMASFNAAVTPLESQVNQLLILTNPTYLEGWEQSGDAAISKITNLLTSDLINDPLGQGKGRVGIDSN